MKKTLPLIIVLVAFGLSISGCVKRVSMVTVEKERVDQDIQSGNKGFISGSIPPEDSPKERVTTRTVYQVTMEIPPYPEWKNFRQSERTIDKEIWGNQGYIYGGPQSVDSSCNAERDDDEKESEDIILPAESSYTQKEDLEEIDVPVMKEPAAKEVSYTIYKIKSGDTLQKVSKTVYGTTTKWKKIYDFNQDTLKNPNKIYPGQSIKIPEL